MTIVVSEISPSDEADWRRLWREWQTHMGGSVSDRASDETWSMLNRPSSGLYALIARNDGGEAVGFAHMSRTFFAWTASSILFLQDFFVVDAERGKGTGTALLRAVYDFADRHGTSQVFWMVDEHDERLKAFYARNATRTPYLRYMRSPWPW